MRGSKIYPPGQRVRVGLGAAKSVSLSATCATLREVGH